MSIHSQEKRPINALQLAIIANRLGNCEDVPLIERPVKSRPPMTGGAENNALPRVTQVGPQRVVVRDEFRDVHQDRRISRFSSFRTNVHPSPPSADVVIAPRRLLHRGMLLLHPDCRDYINNVRTQFPSPTFLNVNKRRWLGPMCNRCSALARREPSLREIPLSRTPLVGALVVRCTLSRVILIPCLKNSSLRIPEVSVATK